jgi:hypothetical protein
MKILEYIQRDVVIEEKTKSLKEKILKNFK